MIIAERKPLTEIWRLIESYRQILVVGCRGCVTVCLAGGAREVANLANLLHLAAREHGYPMTILQHTVERQCEYEFVQPLAAYGQEDCPIEAVVSLGCGIGVQAVAECLPDIPVYPGLNTSFLGMPERSGRWVERCHACGQCLLDKTGGICPIARCAKNLPNGPCGGSQEGKCEIGGGTDCAWQLIYDKLSRLNQLDRLKEIALPKDWSKDRDGGPRRLCREDWEEDHFTDEVRE